MPQQSDIPKAKCACGDGPFNPAQQAAHARKIASFKKNLIPGGPRIANPVGYQGEHVRADEQ